VSQFHPQDVSRLPNRHASRGYAIPTPVDHIPHSIRDFVVVWSRWPSPAQHRVRCCNLRHVRKRRSTRENLSRVSGWNRVVQKGPVRTSQDMTPKVYTSPAVVVGPVWFGDTPGHVISGARLRESRSALVLSLAVQVVEWGRTVAFPRPAIRGLPSLPTRIFA